VCTETLQVSLIMDFSAFSTACTNYIIPVNCQGNRVYVFRLVHCVNYNFEKINNIMTSKYEMYIHTYWTLYVGVKLGTKGILYVYHALTLVCTVVVGIRCYNSFLYIFV